MTPSPSYDEGTSPCRSPARGRTLSANCGNCRGLHSGPSAAATRVSTTRVSPALRVPPLQRQPDRLADLVRTEADDDFDGTFESKAAILSIDAGAPGESFARSAIDRCRSRLAAVA